MHELVLKLAGSFGHRTAGEIIVVLALLLFLAFKGLYSLNGDRAKARQEFLQLWDFERAKRDPLWCEVLIRHYCREFLPARIVINVASNSQAADTLWALSFSAGFFQLDDGFVRWRNRRHEKALSAMFNIMAAFGMYFLLASAAMLLLWSSYRGLRGLRTASGAVLVTMVLVGLLLGGIAIKAMDYGFELASARKNFLKIQSMQPSLVPEPVEELKAVVGNKLAKMRGKRRATQRSVPKATKTR